MENGEIDFASMFYSASRERRLSFSVPHTRMYQAVYVRDDSPEYRSFDVLKGHRISVQNGDIMHDYALEHGLADTLTVTSSLEEALALLAAGQVDYALGSHLQGLHWIRKNGWPHLSAIEGHLIATEYCYAFAKMNTDLRERCNEGLRQVKEKGEYREIYNRWLGVIDLDYSRRWIIQVVLIFLAAAFLLAALAVGSIAVLRHQVRKRTAELEKANAALEESQSKAITLMQDAVLDKEHLQQSLTVAKKSRRALLSVLDDEKRGAVVRARLSAAIEQMAEGVLVTDDGGSIQYVNPAFTTITGYTREEAVGKNPSFLKSGEQDAEFYQRMWRKLIEGDIWRGHFINKRKDGAFYEEEASISPVHDAANKIVNYVAVKRDVTRELHLEAQFAQAQKMESVGRLAGGVAHDFNNLLMGIMGYAELCRGEIPLGHPIREWLDQITHIGQRSAEITRQLLAFASKQTIAPKVLNLNDAVAGMLKLLRQLISEGVTLEWVPGTALRPVKIDPPQVDQILANLCINARDAIDGVGKIILETQNVDIDADFCAEHVEAIPGKYVLLTVSDNGCGMHAETIAKMFEPFFTTKEMGKGTGLGLATVYGIVKQNNGFICAHSEQGKGTRLQIYLPEVTAEVDKIPVLPAEDVPHGHGETILLVEDDPSLCRICQRFLADLGYHVLSAELPDEALKKVGEHAGAIHLLLTDVIMPGMDGRQLANRISAISHGIKILFMSGYTADVIAERGILEKNVAFMVKPFTRVELARKVFSILEKHGPQQD
jgi:PAS domain S-box-containing protein